MKLLKFLSLILIPFLSYSQTTVTLGGGATVTCPATPTATWTTPPSGVSFSNWSRGSGTTCGSANNGLSGSAFNTANYSTSYSGNKFYSVTLTTNSTTTATLTGILWNTAVSSGTAKFTVGYVNNGGTFTTFGTTDQTSSTTNTFTGSVTVNPSTSIVLYLIPSVTSATGTTVRWLNGSTITLSTSAASVISTTGTLSTISTTYGTASSNTSFSVSGTNIVSGISIKPPVGLEVSTSSTFASNVGTNASPIVVGSSGTVSSTTIYVRIIYNAPVGTYNSKNILLTSSGASNVNVSTTSSLNAVAAKSLTVSGASSQNKTYDGTTTATITGTLSGVVSPDNVVLNLSGTFASANVGTAISVTSTSTITGTDAGNYTLTQPTTLSSNITKASQTITFNSIPFKCLSDVDFLPDASSSSGLSLSFSSSDTLVAKIISGKIHVVNIGSCTISCSQSGNTNYLSASSSKVITICDVLSRWSFESTTVSNTGTTPNFGSTSPAANIGDLTTNSLFRAVHSSSSTVWTNAVGNNSSKSISATNWSVNDYYQFRISTKYYTGIKLTVEQTSSGTGPKDFKLQWSPDGTSYTDVSSYTIPYYVPTNSVYAWSSTSYQTQSAISFDLSSINTVENDTSVYFRLVNTSTNAVLGGTVQTGGTSRIDNISIFGVYDAPLSLDLFEKDDKNDIITPKISESECDRPTIYYNSLGLRVSHLEQNKIYFKSECGKVTRFILIN